MGKGDKKSKKGKIVIGSFGNSRKRKSAIEREKRLAAAAAGTDVKTQKPARTR